MNFLVKTKCSVTQKLDVVWCACSRTPDQTQTWASDSRCCKKPRKDTKRPYKITRNCLTASVATDHNAKWGSFLFIGDWHNQCRFWPYQRGMMRCIDSAPGLRPGLPFALWTWPYGEGEWSRQGRRHNYTTCLSILGSWVTLMTIAQALQGKEQLDKATLSSKMGTATLICFLCGDCKWQRWPFLNCSYGQVCRA